MANEQISKQVLKDVFGYSEFRPGQNEIIQAILQNRDAFVLMATGSGKSICYQLPALVLRRQSIQAVTVVISPLISLMEDQVNFLAQRGVAACVIGSSQRDSTVYERALRGEFAIVYVTPERILTWTEPLRRLSASCRLTCFAVDESHCVSSWGHQFRPDYRKLSALRENFPNVPIVALTATATPRVAADIVSSLRLRAPATARSSFNRPNLHYSVRVTDSRSMESELKYVLARSALFQAQGATIIYCLTRAQTEDIHAVIAGMGVSCGMYHAGLSLPQRTQAHRRFMRDEAQVMVATVAFGMGIDKPDVRCVLHIGCSKSIESYYQETGRAGRDGLPSQCVMLFNRAAATKVGFLVGMDSSAQQLTSNAALLQHLTSYATSTECRRVLLLRYFGEEYKAPPSPSTPAAAGAAAGWLSSKGGLAGAAGCCDNCAAAAAAAASTAANGAAAGAGAGGSRGPRDFTLSAKQLFSALADTGCRYGLPTVIAVLRGSKSKQVLGKFSAQRLAAMESYGQGSHFPKVWWNSLAHLLSQHGYLQTSITALGGGGGGFGGRGRGGGFAFTKWGLTAKARRVRHSGEAMPPLVPPADMLHVERQKVAPAAARRAAAAAGAATGAEHGATVVPSGRYHAAPGGPTALPSHWSAEVKDLYAELRKTRSALAQQHGCSPYMIVGEDTLKAMAEFRPSSPATLRQIDGVGEVTVAKFGHRFLSTIRALCGRHKLSCDQIPADYVASAAQRAPPTELPKMTKAKLEAHHLFSSGLSVAAIASLPSRTRPIKDSTVLGYLADAMQNGLEVSWERLLADSSLGAAADATVRRCITKLSQSSAVPVSALQGQYKLIRAAVPEAITYGQLKAVITKMVLEEQPAAPAPSPSPSAAIASATAAAASVRGATPPRHFSTAADGSSSTPAAAQQQQQQRRRRQRLSQATPATVSASRQQAKVATPVGSSPAPTPPSGLTGALKRRLPFGSPTSAPGSDPSHASAAAMARPRAAASTMNPSSSLDDLLGEEPCLSRSSSLTRRRPMKRACRQSTVAPTPVVPKPCDSASRAQPITTQSVLAALRESGDALSPSQLLLSLGAGAGDKVTLARLMATLDELETDFAIYRNGDVFAVL